MKQRLKHILAQVSVIHRFRFIRRYIGGAWIKTTHRGWITYQVFCDYKSYGFDPVALAAEECGKVIWVSNSA